MNEKDKVKQLVEENEVQKTNEYLRVQLKEMLNELDKIYQEKKGVSKSLSNDQPITYAKNLKEECLQVIHSIHSDIALPTESNASKKLINCVPISFSKLEKPSVEKMKINDILGLKQEADPVSHPRKQKTLSLSRTKQSQFDKS